MFGSRDWVDHSSNPCGLACGIRFFIIASGMSEHSFCIFRRIHVRLTWASQVAYECFFFSPAGPALVTKTDTWIRTLLTTRNETNLPLGGSFYAARPTQPLLRKCYLFNKKLLSCSCILRTTLFGTWALTVLIDKRRSQFKLLAQDPTGSHLIWARSGLRW